MKLESKEEEIVKDVKDEVDDVVDEVIGAHGDDQQPAGEKGLCGAVPKKRRLCRYPGCTKVIKSQGHCQRHGARAKRCKVDGCEKQAQVSLVYSIIITLTHT